MPDVAFDLAPAQQRALDELLEIIAPGRGAVLHASDGNGKTTILRAAHARLGGAWIGAAQLQETISNRHPLALEDGLYELIERTLADNTFVFIDDIHHLLRVCDGCHTYPRGGLVYLGMKALAERAAATGKACVFGTSMPFGAVSSFGRIVTLKEFTAEDYRALFSAYLTPAQIAACDFAKVHRFARHLSARIVASVGANVRKNIDAHPETDATDAVIDYLRSAQLVSNVDLGEVQSVKLEDLKGLDDVLRALEANVILPLERSELANELSLKSKRGVLLAGPPGTGKTTIGRALAHRLRGKFFLVDGTMIAGTGQFYHQLHGVFRAAIRNAPSVVFIDDSDVIFEGQDPGLYRYLLTMLDGLESESAGGVCLVMTAMDVGSLPPALVRSGRIELWLETRLPDAAARLALLADLTANLPASMGSIDITRLAAATEELSGADLKRVIEDGKLLYAFDRANGAPREVVTEYFMDAITTVRANKLRYAEAEARARARNPALPPHFAIGMSQAIMQAAEWDTQVVTFTGSG
jgi:transitional endoplasmic reticulum ATPase